jgi:virginiamycin B lyase
LRTLRFAFVLYVEIVAQPYPQSDGTFREFPLPHPNRRPGTIAIGPDGNLWFTEETGNRIGTMAPDGTGLREFDLPQPNSAPRIITMGSDKNLWFTEHQGNRIGCITPAGVMSEFTIPRPACQPRAIALGSDGNL